MDIDIEVSENLYLTLSKMAEDAGQQIGEYAAWVLGRHIADEEQVEEPSEATLALREELGEVHAKNVELTEIIGVLEREAEDTDSKVEGEVEPDGY